MNIVIPFLFGMCAGYAIVEYIMYLVFMHNLKISTMRSMQVARYIGNPINTKLPAIGETYV